MPYELIEGKLHIGNGIVFETGVVYKDKDVPESYRKAYFSEVVEVAPNAADKKRADVAEKAISELTVESEQAQFDACQKSIDAVKDEEAKAALQHKLDELIATKPPAKPANKD